jgi:hypothetical protein
MLIATMQGAVGSFNHNLMKSNMSQYFRNKYITLAVFPPPLQSYAGAGVPFYFQADIPRLRLQKTFLFCCTAIFDYHVAPPSGAAISIMNTEYLPNINLLEYFLFHFKVVSTDVRTDIVPSVTRILYRLHSHVSVSVCCCAVTWCLGVASSHLSHFLIKHPHHARNFSLSTSLTHPLGLDENHCPEKREFRILASTSLS